MDWMGRLVILVLIDIGELTAQLLPQSHNVDSILAHRKDIGDGQCGVNRRVESEPESATELVRAVP
jgi:hypothetical protein